MSFGSVILPHFKALSHNWNLPWDEYTLEIVHIIYINSTVRPTVLSGHRRVYDTLRVEGKYRSRRVSIRGGAVCFCLCQPHSHWRYVAIALSHSAPFHTHKPNAAVYASPYPQIPPARGSTLHRTHISTRGPPSYSADQTSIRITTTRQHYNT